YILNQQLWDSYYFSSIPNGITANNITDLANGTQQLPNHRLRLINSKATPADLRNASNNADNNNFYDTASNFVVEGAFNVNSTSIEAWKALLSSASNLKIPVYDLSRSDAGS